jgi:hypothetical protein
VYNENEPCVCRRSGCQRERAVMWASRCRGRGECGAQVVFGTVAGRRNATAKPPPVTCRHGVQNTWHPFGPQCTASGPSQQVVKAEVRGELTLYLHHVSVSTPHNPFSCSPVGRLNNFSEIGATEHFVFAPISTPQFFPGSKIRCFSLRPYLSTSDPAVHVHKQELHQVPPIR